MRNTTIEIDKKKELEKMIMIETTKQLDKFSIELTNNQIAK